MTVFDSRCTKDKNMLPFFNEDFTLKNQSAVITPKMLRSSLFAVVKIWDQVNQQIELSLYK